MAYSSPSKSPSTAQFAAILGRLEEPLAGAAETLNKSGESGSSGKEFGQNDLHKVKFSEFADRVENLAQMLPDAFRCIQQVTKVQKSLSESLQLLEEREKQEEQFQASLDEVQAQVEARCRVAQEEVAGRIGLLRECLAAREAFLSNRIRHIQADKIKAIEGLRAQSSGALAKMREASRTAHALMSEGDASAWLDSGEATAHATAKQAALQASHGALPDPAVRCTLSVDLQRRILEVLDFDENKPVPTGSGYAGLQSGLLSSNPAASYSLLNSSMPLLSSSSADAHRGLGLADNQDYAAFRKALLTQGALAGLASSPSPHLSHLAAASRASPPSARASPSSPPPNPSSPFAYRSGPGSSLSPQYSAGAGGGGGGRSGGGAGAGSGQGGYGGGQAGAGAQV